MSQIKPTKHPGHETGFPIEVTLSTSIEGRVRLSLLGDGMSWSSRLTSADAKRVAYALLLAADGIEPSR